MHILRWLFLILLCVSFTTTLFANSNVTVITSIQPSGMTINTPGIYVFGNDITWSPVGDGQAILITADNVILDLQNHALTSVTTNYETKGIVIALSSNVIIKNGTVSNMAIGGIECEACLGVVIVNMNVDGLNLNNIVDYRVPTGILASTSGNVSVIGCTVRNFDVTTGSSAGIQMTGTILSRISHCAVLNLLNRDGACTGIGSLLCDIVDVSNCVIDGLETQFHGNENTEGHTCIGFVPVLSTNVSLANSSVANIIGCCDDAHGVSIFECLGAIVKNCQVFNVLDGAGPAQTGAKATGIEVYASDVTVSRCRVKNIFAINPQDKQATGFSCAQCYGVTFYKCTAENVQVYDENGNQSSCLGYGTGFGWAPDPRPEFIFPSVNILYKKCTAKRCQVGFDSWYHIDSEWDHIRSYCNGIAILDLDHSERTISCNSCSECGCQQVGCYPTPLVVTLENVAHNNKFKHVKSKYCL